MNKALSFAKLDFMTVKTYFTLKNLALIVASPLFLVFASGRSESAIGIFMIFSALYISYPFIICEKNDMDALYTTLSITRRSVVQGRYLFTLALSICAGLFGLVFSVIASVVLGETLVWGEALLTLLSLFAAISLIEAIQLPIYFKLGYEKAKILAYLPYMAFGLAAIGFTSLFPQGVELGGRLRELLEWVTANPAVAGIIAAAVWLAIMVISYRTSLSNYRRREF